MLKSAEIINYRSCAGITIDEISNLLVLLGRNGAGKSNVMKAIEWAAKNASGISTAEIDKEFRTNYGEVKLKFLLDGETYTYYIKRLTDLVLKDDDVNSWVESSTFLEKLEKQNTKDEIDVIFDRNGETIKIPYLERVHEVSNEIDLPPITLPPDSEKSPFKNHLTCLSFCA